MPEFLTNAIAMLRPCRRITGASAILLPFSTNGNIDWPAFRNHVQRTAQAGLIPAVNMDTGYVNLLDDATRLKVLDEMKQVIGTGDFMAGAFVGDNPESRFDRDAYLRQIEWILSHGGTPVIFQSHGLVNQADNDILVSYAELGRHCDRFIGFELSPVFASFGKIYSLELYRELLTIPQCIGAKHSSLRRDLEWQRLALRDCASARFSDFYRK